MKFAKYATLAALPLGKGLSDRLHVEIITSAGLSDDSLDYDLTCHGCGWTNPGYIDDDRTARVKAQEHASVCTGLGVAA
ncbi:hypothetical protein [Streptomyces cavernicola]|uniref:Uncharacterized protein n=1 Tax=Streptomyces cavernicola TaxID=3043613 RepID=A0ABT6SJE0_9ACTN|nr:hypothetical protein [Streptomyces sp. B-S-A6]MDI3408320.1 hypothetical protein [Streptomyces sp. B-S-A6]